MDNGVGNSANSKSFLMHKTDHNYHEIMYFVRYIQEEQLFYGVKPSYTFVKSLSLTNIPFSDENLKRRP